MVNFFCLRSFHCWQASVRKWRQLPPRPGDELTRFSLTATGKPSKLFFWKQSSFVFDSWLSCLIHLRIPIYRKSWFLGARFIHLCSGRHWPLICIVKGGFKECETTTDHKPSQTLKSKRHSVWGILFCSSLKFATCLPEIHGHSVCWSADSMPPAPRVVEEQCRECRHCFMMYVFKFFKTT